MKRKAGPIKYKRRIFLLDILEHEKKYMSMSCIQEAVRRNQISDNLSFYDFIQYKGKTYSIQLEKDIEVLRQKGFLVSDIHDDIVYYAPSDYFTTQDLHDKAFVFTDNNDMEFGTDCSAVEKDSESIDDGIQKKVSPVLYTIGYEGKSIESFVNICIQNDINILCDVRRNPLSRKFGFSKNVLKSIIESVGIEYMHFPELGIDSQKRSNLVTKQDYQKLFMQYSATIHSHAQVIDMIYSHVCKEMRIALMCYEKDANMYHRHVIRDFMVDKYHIAYVDL